MADKTKKTKAPAKAPVKATASAKAPATATTEPRKTTTKNVKVTQAPRPAMPPREEIERLARAYWAQRGYQDGYAEQDWLRAEQELLQKAS